MSFFNKIKKHKLENIIYNILYYLNIIYRKYFLFYII